VRKEVTGAPRAPLPLVSPLALRGRSAGRLSPLLSQCRGVRCASPPARAADARHPGRAGGDAWRSARAVDASGGARQRVCNTRLRSARLTKYPAVPAKALGCVHISKKHCDSNIFSAVPANAGTQSHALHLSGLNLLDARFRGQGETGDVASVCDLYVPWRESGDHEGAPVIASDALDARFRGQSDIGG
jgi:hypothetical protein